MSIAENLQRVNDAIATAASKSGRTVDDVELIAVTKTHPAETIREAIEAGQKLFGESKLQEATTKLEALKTKMAATNAALAKAKLGEIQLRSREDFMKADL